MVLLGLVAAVVGGAPKADDGGAGSCWLGFLKGSIPAASCAIWLRGSATGEGWGDVLLGGGKIPSFCLSHYPRGPGVGTWHLKGVGPGDPSSTAWLGHPT